jgi:hypothetical protein
MSRVQCTAALESSDDDDNINRVWETITGNIKISPKDSQSYYELKQHEPWFNETCSSN